MNDNCIITKYDSIEKDKLLKEKLFKRNKSNEVINQNQTSYKYNVVCNKTNQNQKENLDFYNNKAYFIPEEKLEQLVKENFPNNINQNSNPQPNSNQNHSQLNLIYNQNRILERNVDICQETQRILHDFLKYNIENNENYKNSSNKQDYQLMIYYINEIKKAISEENKGAVEKLIKPLFSEMEIIKNGLKSAKKEYDDNYKKGEVYIMKEEISKANKSIGQLEKNTKNDIGKDNKKVKDDDYSELMKTLKLVESTIQQEFKKLNMTKEKNDLYSLFTPNTEILENDNKTDKIKDKSYVKNRLGNFDYYQFKSSIIDDLHSIQSINSSFFDGKLEKSFSFTLSQKEKVNKSKKTNKKDIFSYDLTDEETEDSLNKTIETVKNESKIYKSITKENVFLNNLKNNNEQQKKTSQKKKEVVDNSKSSIQTQKKNIIKKKENVNHDDLNNRKVSKSLLNDEDDEKTKILIPKKTENDGDQIKNIEKEEKFKNIVKEHSESNKEDVNKTIFKEINKQFNNKTSNKDIIDINQNIEYKENSKSTIVSDIITRLIIDKFTSKNNKNETKIKEDQSNNNKDELREIVQKAIVDRLKQSKINKKEEKPEKVEAKNELQKESNYDEIKKKIDENNKDLNERFNEFIEKISFFTNEVYKKIEKNNNSEVSEVYIERLTEKYINQRLNMNMTDKFNIHINIPNDIYRLNDENKENKKKNENKIEKYEIKNEVNVDILNHHKKINEDIEKEKEADNEYYNPFDINYDNTNEKLYYQIQAPYEIDFNQYEFTVLSSSMTKSNNTITITENTNDCKGNKSNLTRNIIKNTSLSEGEVQYSTLQNPIRQEKPSQISDGEQDVDGDYENNKTNELSSLSYNDSQSLTYSLNKSYIEKNTIEQLKRDNLYISEEYKLFKKAYEEEKIFHKVEDKKNNIENTYDNQSSKKNLDIENFNFSSNRLNTHMSFNPHSNVIYYNNNNKNINIQSNLSNNDNDSGGNKDSGSGSKNLNNQYSSYRINPIVEEISNNYDNIKLKNNEKEEESDRNDQSYIGNNHEIRRRNYTIITEKEFDEERTITPQKSLDN